MKKVSSEQHQGDGKNYYVAIDLGTTNSLLAWGHVDPRMNLITPKVMDVRMMISGGGIGDRPLLPSCVYFKEGQEPIVGEYAKTMMGRQSARVVRSSKSRMGSAEGWHFDGKDHAPEQIAALVLKQLASGAKNLFGFIPKDVVVTVPASFDSDMREATLRAAAEAGFTVTEEDGSPRNILLDEPRAALYDFVNRQERGEIPDSLVDFSEPKNVLVFDLGGGTLDVSLHTVGYEENTRNIWIKDYAVSRYTRIGGDNFDLLLMKHFLEIFSRKVPLETLDAFDRGLLETQFMAFAEEAKLSLNARIESRRMMGHEHFDDVEIEMIKANAWDGRTFECDLSMVEYEDIVAPLLGRDLAPEDMDRLDNLSEESTETIIYPILDVLQKAKEKNGGTPVEVDAVLLNGGMTKLETIRQRLEEFFGMPPLAAGDPDKAVARGAVVYHFNLHRGARPTSILNDTIGVGVAGGAVKHLVQAGTTLPYKSPVLSDFVALTGASYLDLPFYLGRRRDTLAPNRKIATRRVRFPQPLKEGEEIDLQVTLDDRGIMTVDGWVRHNPRARFSVTVLSSRQEEDLPELEKKSGNVLPGGFRKKPAPANGQEEESLPRGEKLSVPSIVSALEKSLERWQKLMGTGNGELQSAEMGKIRHLEASIVAASNGEDFVDPLRECFERKIPGKERILFLLGELGVRNAKARRDVAALCMFLADPQRGMVLDPREINTSVRYAVEALGKMSYSGAEPLLLKLLSHARYSSVFSSVLHSLGKIEATERAVPGVAKFLQSSSAGERMGAAWAMGRMGTRERQNPLPIATLRVAFDPLIRGISRTSHADVLRNLIYALGEIGDRRFPDKDIIFDKEAQRMQQALTSLKDRKTTNKKLYEGTPVIQKFVDIALAMIGGVELTQEQSSTLLALRSQLKLK
jgi:molecular chaperone DnaK (HSP70)/HEAT repeat protein